MPSYHKIPQMREAGSPSQAVRVDLPAFCEREQGQVGGVSADGSHLLALSTNVWGSARGLWRKQRCMRLSPNSQGVYIVVQLKRRSDNYEEEKEGSGEKAKQQQEFRVG